MGAAQAFRIFLGRCLFETGKRTAAGKAIFTCPGDCSEFFGCDPRRNGVADVAGFLKKWGDAASADGFVYRHLRHLCDGIDSGRPIYAVHFFWSGGAVDDDRNRRHRLTDAHKFFHVFLAQKARPAHAAFGAGKYKRRLLSQYSLPFANHCGDDVAD